MAPARVVLVDNFDSFVYNLAQSLGSLGAEPVVFRNDRPLADLEEAEPDALVISPGPGAPHEAGVSLEAVRAFAGRVPLLGVCLGHQCIAAALGATVSRARVGPVHGKTSAITHDGSGVFAGLPVPLAATRYHSLAVEPATLPPELVVTATSDDGVVMGIRHIHAEAPLEGVQFHPESVLTGQGDALLGNFLAAVGAPQASARR
jgi:anthranilate synthase component II